MNTETRQASSPPAAPAKTRLPQDEEIIDLRQIFHVLNSHRWAIIGFTAAVTLVAILVVFSMTPIYQATATLQIEQEQAKVLSIEEVYGIDGGTDSYLNTQFEVLKSRGVLEKVVNKLDLLNNPEFNGRLKEAPWYAGMLDWRSWFGLKEPEAPEDPGMIMRDTINTLAASVSIEPVRKTQIVKIHAQSENPQLAAKIANAIANAYIESYMESKLALTLNATDWMQGRMGELSEKLKVAEEELQDYREQENLIELEGVLNASSDELKALTNALVQVRSKLAVSENIYKQIRSGAMRKGDSQSLQAVLKHPLIQNLKQEESKVERLVTDLSRRYGPKHPQMISAKSELESIRQNMNLQIGNIVAGVEREYEIDKANERSLSAAVDELKQRIQITNRKEFRLRALEREVQTNKDLYDAFFKRIQETSATSDLQTANARIVDKAFTPKTPVKPKKKLIVAVAMLMGLLISCGIAFLLEMLNNTIRTTRDVEEKLNLPVLGVLPKLTDKTVLDHVFNLFTDKQQAAFGEAVRTIRTSVNLTAMDQQHRLFAVTSTVPGEGKSSVASNLALSLGQLGKTLLIDCDLRRPVVGKNFHIKGGSVGLANLLAGTANVNEAVHKLEGIDAIPCGMVPPNPQELLSTERFAALLKKLREHYDYVVLDCPPVQNVSDVLMVSRHCDGLVYVVEAGRMQSNAVSAAVGRLLQARASVTGAVLNKINPKAKDTYGYNQGYYDSTGYYSGAS
ncbi:polysaccharide biosynthesis tyrosine autokinase [Endozoicomonas sp. GU-1]|uniref:GumC family protein n=1 Tax=Endozoicomonas sp. GU-1 TaxID=3009078 RepID=UPI0022B5507A|nr:polysaccharide biosynthesis tyrosine autokinase [Endozoicomonas sp. GU-1]WBA81499.1 polysaccharide biosynthesis tyrosine autokinase [Endozoicomonas sp. GU-1]WBA84447.1 polysaccharide biosynthesis tyrosine autokinase [Endozoicomonas sp. GU-1]